ncbi:MAG: WHG domain-containing protein [Acidimicrobiales bacterium]|nr:WHG domain-containing protein [Acidimicrobiales bacterium]
MTPKPPVARVPLDQEQVVNAAADLADAEGLDALTLTRVAKILGVRQPALYRHVESYQDLLRLLSLRGRDQLAVALSEAAIGVSGDEAIGAVGRAWRETVLASPGLYEATDRHPCAGDEELEEAVERIVGVIAQALVGFDLGDDHRVHSARALRSAFHGFCHLESGDGHPHPHDLDLTFDGLIELLCAGIRSQTPAGQTV